MDIVSVSIISGIQGDYTLQSWGLKCRDLNTIKATPVIEKKEEGEEEEGEEEEGEEKEEGDI